MGGSKSLDTSDSSPSSPRIQIIKYHHFTETILQVVATVPKEISFKIIYDDIGVRMKGHVVFRSQL